MSEATETKTIENLIGEAIGEASMCWDPRPTGVFESDRASGIVDRILCLARAPGVITPHAEDEHPLPADAISREGSFVHFECSSGLRIATVQLLNETEAERLVALVAKSWRDQRESIISEGMRRLRSTLWGDR